MKVVSWNCHGAFRKKYHLLDYLSADILVIQECEDPERSTSQYREWAGEHLWVGQSKNKGIGVFSRSGVKLEALDWDDEDLQIFLPCKVDGKITLVGVWTKKASSPTFGYIGQFWKYFQKHKESIGSHPTVICGDFNSNSIWDEGGRWWNHSNVVNELEQLKIRSLYHLATGENQGNENTATLYMYRKAERPYHVDYAFASDSIIDRNHLFIIGSPNKWLEYSDHMPMIFSVDC